MVGAAAVPVVAKAIGADAKAMTIGQWAMDIQHASWGVLTEHGWEIVEPTDQRIGDGTYPWRVSWQCKQMPIDITPIATSVGS
jgi:hypothetical protein